MRGLNLRITLERKAAEFIAKGRERL